MDLLIGNPVYVATRINAGVIILSRAGMVAELEHKFWIGYASGFCRGHGGRIVCIYPAHIRGATIIGTLGGSAKHA